MSVHASKALLLTTLQLIQTKIIRNVNVNKKTEDGNNVSINTSSPVRTICSSQEGRYRNFKTMMMMMIIMMVIMNYCIFIIVYSPWNTLQQNIFLESGTYKTPKEVLVSLYKLLHWTLSIALGIYKLCDVSNAGSASVFRCERERTVFSWAH
jgi:hypothetical protein